MLPNDDNVLMLQECVAMEFGVAYNAYLPKLENFGIIDLVAEHTFFSTEGVCSNMFVAKMVAAIVAVKKGRAVSESTVQRRLKSSPLADVFSYKEFLSICEELFLPYIETGEKANIKSFITKDTLELLVMAMEHRAVMFSMEYWDERGKRIGCVYAAMMYLLHSEEANRSKEFRRQVKVVDNMEKAFEKYCKKNSYFAEVFGNFSSQALLRLIRNYFGPMVLMAFQQNEVQSRLLEDVYDFFGDMLRRGFIQVATQTALREFDASDDDDDDDDDDDTEVQPKAKRRGMQKTPFNLTGRHELTKYFNEYIIDVVKNEKIYSKFGIGFPDSFILEGPPGCGKTYAIERLTEYLGWNEYHITSSTIGSKLIHETSKKTEAVFKEAAKSSPSVVIIDEMDAFLPDRGKMRSTDGHQTEEVASFLRCIQNAAKNKVLVIGMTNMMENIDPAILRSGRMGKHLKVDMPSVEEIMEVIEHELTKRPHEKIDVRGLAEKFLNKPLSDVVALVREASMIAARGRAKQLTSEHLQQALETLKSNDKEEKTIGFNA